MAVAAAAVTTERNKIRWDKSRKESYPVSPSPCVRGENKVTIRNCKATIRNCKVILHN